MAVIKHHKFVAALPATLEANSVYFVRTGAGYDQYVTNSSGQIVAYPANKPALATTGADGLMPAADKAKLNGVEEGAQKNVATNLGLGQNRDAATITSSTGTNVSIPSATTLLAGVMSADDKVKVNGVQAGATVNSPDATLLNRAYHTGTQTLATISDAGNAAAATLAASAVDFTAVRVMTTGYAGWGGTAPSKPGSLADQLSSIFYDTTLEVFPIAAPLVNVKGARSFAVSARGDRAWIYTYGQAPVLMELYHSANQLALGMTAASARAALEIVQGAVIPAGSLDFNSGEYLVTGEYLLPAAADGSFSNAPTATTGNSGLSRAHLSVRNTANYIVQSLVSASLNKRYERTYTGASWLPWTEVWGSQNFNPAEYAKLAGPTFTPIGVTPAISLQGSVAYAMFKDAAGTNVGFVGKAAAAANNAIYLGAYASDIILSTASGYYTQIDRSPPAGDRTSKAATAVWVGAEIVAANTGTPIITDASTANTLTVARFANGAPYMRFTNAGAFLLTVPANSQQAIPVGAEITLRRAANANLTISPASGVVINPPAGGTLVMTQNMTATLKKVAANEWDLIGQTVAA